MVLMSHSIITFELNIFFSVESMYVHYDDILLICVWIGYITWVLQWTDFFILSKAVVLATKDFLFPVHWSRSNTMQIFFFLYISTMCGGCGGSVSVYICGLCLSFLFILGKEDVFSVQMECYMFLATEINMSYNIIPFWWFFYWKCRYWNWIKKVASLSYF